MGYKMEFHNAVVTDDGFGLEIGGRSLEKMISIMLGVLDKKETYRADRPKFRSNNCDVTVIINPRPTTVLISNEKESWESVEQMEDVMDERYNKKAPETETEE